MPEDLKGWTPSTEGLLQNWSKQISINEREHRKRGSWYGSTYVGSSIIVNFTIGIGVVLLIYFLASNDSSSNAIIISIVLEALGLVANILSQILNFGSKSKDYYDAAKDFNALARLIDGTLTLRRKDRDNAREFLLSVRQQFDSIQDNSPNLPNNRIIHKLELRIYQDPEKAKGNSRCNSPEEEVSPSSSEPEVIVGIPDLLPNPNQDVLPNPNEDLLPIPNPTKVYRSDSTDENYITNAHRHNFRNKFLRTKSSKNIHEHSKLKSNMQEIDYQLQRMERHAEQRNTPTPERSASTQSRDSPV